VHSVDRETLSVLQIVLILEWNRGQETPDVRDYKIARPRGLDVIHAR
jgi:hypothetical protein